MQKWSNFTSKSSSWDYDNRQYANLAIFMFFISLSIESRSNQINYNWRVPLFANAWIDESSFSGNIKHPGPNFENPYKFEIYEWWLSSEISFVYYHNAAITIWSKTAVRSLKISDSKWFNSCWTTWDARGKIDLYNTTGNVLIRKNEAEIITFS